MFKHLCKHHYVSRQPIFTSKTYNHVVTYNHASADGNLQKIEYPWTNRTYFNGQYFYICEKEV